MEYLVFLPLIAIVIGFTPLLLLLIFTHPVGCGEKTIGFRFLESLEKATTPKSIALEKRKELLKRLCQLKDKHDLEIIEDRQYRITTYGANYVKKNPLGWLEKDADTNRHLARIMELKKLIYENKEGVDPSAEKEVEKVEEKLGSLININGSSRRRQNG